MENTAINIFARSAKLRPSLTEKVERLIVPTEKATSSDEGSDIVEIQFLGV